ncbi:fungal-specific transcription factor domain-containing protein [Thelonectria olida]|uniref:Fungal-specific transcription factor domain-containing protein n=1 Tax=Thelonectria olida TaxID=1576542 RepID=A0A9P8VUE7_9HYPO|nr:fungal-specific transcription factor domain-containing protein [Thelonectria olida]
MFQLDQASQQHFVGESTCLAFGDRILQCFNPQSTTPPRVPDHQYVRDPIFARQTASVSGVKLPERIRVNLLIRVALRFIGQDYHFFLHHDFLQQLNKAYELSDSPPTDSVWVCKFFAVLALGELYSNSTPTNKDSPSSSVPGTNYFLTAVRLLQDLFEEPSIAQIETMLLFCFYSNALGRIKSAHMYSGIAMRLSTCLGLHRSIPEGSTLSPTEREHRIRLWWTVYVFERSTCSKLGQPLTIHDSDIDVAMPWPDTFTADNNPQKLGRPEHLTAHVNLARITGQIMSDLYSPSSKTNTGKFVHNVRAILQRLRKWDAHVPTNLRWQQEGGVPRSVASLQLHYNHCIILTTRPVLLYVLKVRNPFSNSATGSTVQQVPISDTTRSLADSCISAARTSNSILSQLFVENALATCGYFDAHHLFASTLVLIISAITSPNSSDSDAVQTAFQLLMVMRDKGNLAAGEYFARLAQIQWSVSRLFTRATTTEDAIANDASAGTAANAPSPNPPPPETMEFDSYDWGNFLIPSWFYPSYDDASTGNITGDPLDNPLLQAFLDHTDASMDGDSLLTAEEMGFVL